MTGAIQGKLEVLGSALFTVGEAHPYQPHRLGVGATAGPGDAGGGNGQICAESLADSRRHGESHGLGDRTMLPQDRLWNTQERGLHPVRVGDHAAEKVVGGAGHFGDAFADEASRAGLGHRQGLAPLAQEPAHHLLHGLGVAAVDEGTEPLANRIADPSQLRLGFGGGGTAGHRAKIVVGERRAEAEAHAVLPSDVSEICVEIRFTDAEGAQQGGSDDKATLDARQALGNPRQNLLVHHLMELAGHTRHAEEQGPGFFEQTAGRGSDRIGKHLGALRKARLLCIVRRHLPTEAGKEGLDRLE